MELLAAMVLGHLLADFPLQSNAIAVAKAKSIYGLLVHVTVHIVVMWLLLDLDFNAWPLIASMGLAHFIVDWAKNRNRTMSGVALFLVDQFAHFFCILVISWIVTSYYPLNLHIILPSSLLHFATVAGFCLPTIVLYWIWLNTLDDVAPLSSHRLCWGKNHLLCVEQRAGMGLICIVSIGAFLNH